MYEETFTKVIDATGRLKRLVASKQVTTINTKFLPVLEKQAQETKGEIRKAFSKAFNTFSSIRDGIKNGDVDAKIFDETLTELQALRKLVARVEKKPVKEKQTADEVAVNDSISDSGEGRNGTLQDQGHAAMQKYQKYESMVPKRLPDKKRFMAIRIPIVAVTDPLLMKEKLARFKLCDDTIFGYPFVKNQTLIGMNADWVAREFKRQVKPAVDEMLEALEESTGTKYMQLGVSKTRDHVVWVWVVSERDMRYLNQSALGGHFRVTGWNLPFEVDPSTHTRSPSKVKR